MRSSQLAAAARVQTCAGDPDCPLPFAEIGRS